LFFGDRGFFMQKNIDEKSKFDLTQASDNQRKSRTGQRNAKN